jgi:ubiquinone/menaquinone biosynthesis C-methylase UbiE
MFSGLKGLEDGHCITYGHDRIYEFVDSVDRGTLLEAGCGAGHNGVNLSKRGFTVTSVDLTLSGVRAARRLAEHEGQDIAYLCADIKRLPFEDNAFDVCFCSLVLHHFVSLENVIKELARVTKKHFIAFEVSALDPISFVRFNVINPTVGISNISKNQRALFPGRLEKTLKQYGFEKFVTRYDDMHEYFGRRPDSAKARMLRAYQTVMKIFPAKYSQNKFMLRGTKPAI